MRRRRLTLIRSMGLTRPRVPCGCRAQRVSTLRRLLGAYWAHCSDPGLGHILFSTAALSPAPRCPARPPPGFCTSRRPPTMAYKCPHYGCDKEFPTSHRLSKHESRWCAYKADSTRHLLTKRTAELEEERSTKRARLEADREIRSRADSVSFFYCSMIIHYYINDYVHYYSTGSPS